MLPVSVVICTHNPREDYLRRVLDALRAQALPKDQWELLLVDNASAKPLAGTWDLSWHPRARHIREDTPGKTHALFRAITEFTGELFIIVDDDNVLREDYLNVAVRISAEYPWLGAWAGSYRPEFEIVPPVELLPWMAGLVIEKLTTAVWAKLQYVTYACPSGAGMVVRRKQVLLYGDLVQRDPLRQLLGPCEQRPGAGDDGDMALCGFELGWGTGRFPELELTHLVPARKLNLEFIEALHEGMGYAGEILNAVYRDALKVQAPPSPGQFRAGKLRFLLLNAGLLALGKNRVERRMRLALEKGRLRAKNDLRRLGR
ncbi:MAG: glycosyltransferase [Verrucomicrobiota bacterium]|jgi:hypothetical protein